MGQGPILVLAALVLLLFGILLLLRFGIFERRTEAADGADAATPAERAANRPAGELVLKLDALGLDARQLWVLAPDRLLFADGQQVKLLTPAGRVVAEAELSLPEVDVTLVGDVALVTGPRAYRYAVWDRSGERYQGLSEEPIVGYSLSTQGRIALLLDKADSIGLLRVLDHDGGHLFDWTARDVLQSGHVIQSVFDSSDRYLDVLLLNTSASEAQALVSRFSLADQDLGERLLRFEPQGAGVLVWAGRAPDGGLLCASRTELLLERENQLQPIWQQPAFDAFVASGDWVHAVARSSVGGRRSYYRVALDGRATEGIAVPEQAKDLAAAGSRAIMTDGSALLEFSRDGDSFRRHEVYSEIVSSRLLADGSAYVMTGDELRRLELD
ncbi:MAG: hypothetical protein QM270_04640 [Bacillota bacterium]|nr:hypothetical protein [Bacillota bacterium]